MPKQSFLGTFLADHEVAAIGPSSPYLIRRLLRHLQPERMRTIVELGAGPGPATIPILNRMPVDGHYFAFEKNPQFANTLRALNDTRLHVMEADVRNAAEHLRTAGVTVADAVIASIPFTYFSPTERTTLINMAYDLLPPGGDCIIFHQYSPLMAPYLKKKFGSVQTEFELFNVFPCFLMHAKKPVGSLLS
jgi:phospholipid N-methyltransferase